MLAQRPSKRTRQRLQQEALRHISGNQNKDTVTAVLVMTGGPRDSGIAESLPQPPVQAAANRHPVRIGPAAIPEPLHVHDENGPMHRRPQMRHTTSRAKPGASPPPISMHSLTPLRQDTQAPPPPTVMITTERIAEPTTGTGPVVVHPPRRCTASAVAGAGGGAASFTKTPLGSRRYARASLVASLVSTASCRSAPIISARPSRKIAVSASSSVTCGRPLAPRIEGLRELAAQQAELQRDIGGVEAFASLFSQASLRRPDLHRVSSTTGTHRPYRASGMRSRPSGTPPVSR